jgi:hypothetical protein
MESGINIKLSSSSSSLPELKIKAWKNVHLQGVQSLREEIKTKFRYF